MLHANLSMGDIDVDHWRNLQALVLESAKAKRRIIVIHENGEIEKFVHSQRRRSSARSTRIDDPHAAAKAIYEANAAVRLRARLRAPCVRSLHGRVPGHVALRRGPRCLRAADVCAHGHVPRRHRHVPGAGPRHARAPVAVRVHVRRSDGRRRPLHRTGDERRPRRLRRGRPLDDARAPLRRRPARRRRHDRRSEPICGLRPAAARCGRRGVGRGAVRPLLARPASPISRERRASSALGTRSPPSPALPAAARSSPIGCRRPSLRRSPAPDRARHRARWHAWPSFADLSSRRARATCFPAGITPRAPPAGG